MWKYDNIAAKNRQGSVRNVKRIVNKTITDEDHSKDWILPKEGEVGYIEKSFGEVLGLEYVSYYKTTLLKVIRRRHCTVEKYHPTIQSINFDY